MQPKERSSIQSSSFLRKIKNGLAGIVLGAGLALAPAYATLNPSTAEAKAAECVPHYLQGLKRPEDKLENMLEKDRVYNTMLQKYPAKPRTRTINGSIEEKVKIHDVEVTMIFPNYVKDGKNVRHYNATGIDVYSEKEFQCVMQDQIEYIKGAANLAMEDYENTLRIILSAQEKALRREGLLKEGEKLKDFLDKPVPNYKGLKVRDILFTPDIKMQDFVPARYYFGEIAALGVTYINTGIVGIDPKARVLDYINGWPTVLVHEMTHRNPKIQSYPIMRKFDPELWASFPMLVHDDMSHFMYHGYLEDLRKISKILFNFDSELAYNDMVALDTMMGTEYESYNKYKKMREYMKKVELISQAIRDTAFNKYIPEFYTHPLYYIALNEFMKDDNSAFKLIMYTSYEPTLLEGPEKTRDFVQENYDTVREVARKTMIQLKGMQKDEMTDEQQAEIKRELKHRLDEMSLFEKDLLVKNLKQMGMPPTGNTEDLIEFGLRMYRLGLVDFTFDKKEELLKK